MLDLVISTFATGFLWSLLSIGVFITYRILDIEDLSVEGTYPLGAAVAAVCIAGGGSPLLAIALAMLAGMIAGMVTGLLHTKLKIPALLAGILTMIALYSINLKVMGKANVSILGEGTVYSYFMDMGLSRSNATLVVGVLVTVIIVLACYLFFGTEIGASIRATGDNQQMIRAQGVNTDNTIILGLVISNGLVAITGALIAQSTAFADVGMGTGTIVIGLASVIIGEVLFGRRSFLNWLIAVVLGSIVYRVVIAIVLWLGLDSNDLKLLTAIIVAIALSMPLIKDKMQGFKRLKGGS